jgi:hypothetical protein
MDTELLSQTELLRQALIELIPLVELYVSSAILLISINWYCNRKRK